MAKKNDKKVELFTNPERGMVELRSEIEIKYARFMFWVTSGLAGGFFLILIAIAINYFFGNTPPTP